MALDLFRFMVTSPCSIDHNRVQVLTNATYTGPNADYLVGFTAANAPGTPRLFDTLASARFSLMACSAQCKSGMCAASHGGVECTSCSGNYAGGDCHQCDAGACPFNLF